MKTTDNWFLIKTQLCCDLINTQYWVLIKYNPFGLYLIKTQLCCDLMIEHHPKGGVIITTPKGGVVKNGGTTINGGTLIKPPLGGFIRKAT